MDKVCDYCKEVGEAYTFRRYVDADETICGKCLRVLPTDAVAGRRMVYDLRAALTTAREENERLKGELEEAREGLAARVHRNLNTDIDALMSRNEALTAENANLRAATRGTTFFHSDEEVNAEIGRLRAKVERYGEALQEIMQDCGDSTCGCCQIDSNIAEAALKEPQWPHKTL